MEDIIMEHKKHFSKLGLLLLLSSAIIFVVQFAAGKLFNLIPAVSESSNLSFLVVMLSMYVIAFPIIFKLFEMIPVHTSTEKKKLKPGQIFLAFTICYAATYLCNFIGVMITTVIGMLKQGSVDNVMLELTGSIHPYSVHLLWRSFCFVKHCCPAPSSMEKAYPSCSPDLPSDCSTAI